MRKEEEQIEERGKAGGGMSWCRKEEDHIEERGRASVGNRKSRLRKEEEQMGEREKQVEER